MESFRKNEDLKVKRSSSSSSLLKFALSLRKSKETKLVDNSTIVAEKTLEVSTQEVKKAKNKLEKRWNATTITRHGKEQKDNKLRKVIYLVKSPFYEAFKTFAKTNLWIENFLFIEEYRNFKKLLRNNESNEQIKAAWQALNKNFIGYQSRYAINIKDSTIIEFANINSKIKAIEESKSEEKKEEPKFNDLKKEMKVVLKSAAEQIAALILLTQLQTKFSEILENAKGNFPAKQNVTEKKEVVNEEKNKKRSSLPPGYSLYNNNEKPEKKSEKFSLRNTKS